MTGTPCIPPPPPDEELKPIHAPMPETDTKNWRDILETSRETWRAPKQAV